jgi:hypothetical protein
MIETKNNAGQIKIAFFDADKTLWKVVTKNPGDDYASRGAKLGRDRTFLLGQENEVTRLEDGTKLILKEGVKETLEKLSKEGITAAIISDNIYDDVEVVCQRLGIWKFFDETLTNIWLWNGQADKSLMVKQVVGNLDNSASSKILLVDDGLVYAEQMQRAGYDFIVSPKETFPKDVVLEYFGLK